MELITLAHGSGGRLSHELVEEVIYPIFNNNGGQDLLDAAVIPVPVQPGKLAMTTDSYVISPIFFPGGDIGRLAACGTINDLAVCGAIPKFMSVGLIIEEGFPIRELKQVLHSLADTAAEAGVSVVTGDTKVVEKGNVDKIYINTAGIGFIPPGVNLNPQNIKPGDVVIVSGTLGDHEMAVLSCREGLSFGIEVVSDCAALNDLTKCLVATGAVKCMRDPTRGGAAASLWELAGQSKMTIEIQEAAIPLHPSVAAGCSMLGLDPLYLANEGKLVIIVNPEGEKEIIARLKNHSLGRNAAVIGKVANQDRSGKVLLQTALGAKRLVTLNEGEHLPRIC
ncbi:MAG: hydrogenase expression/formation protein HypE [Bacillota bacterium]